MKLDQYLHHLHNERETVDKDRKKVLQSIVSYIQNRLNTGGPLQLIFICTHNSRRSQFAQIWAQTAADYYGVSCGTYSGGVEVTAFNHRAIDALAEKGFGVTKSEGTNPIIKIHNSYRAMKCFSKLVDDELNPKNHFAAIMTCSHADENCPMVHGMEKRIALNYEDPGRYDGTEDEQLKYNERSEQIAKEMFYIFSQFQ